MTDEDLAPPITPEREREVIDSLKKDVLNEWLEENRDKFLGMSYDSLGALHHGFGTFIRNHYGLWKHKWDPEIKDHVDYSPQHPDQASMRIIRTVWTELNDEQ